jgi:trehalose 6-phosphate synthase/phosphatase
MTTTVASVASAGRLLVACDFDGVLAPIVDDPDEATATAASMAALQRLAKQPNTMVAIISGRRRSQLLERFPDEGFVLIGEHGADYSTDPTSDRPSLTLARELVDAVVAQTPGSRAEHKARSVVFHYRQAEEPKAALATLRGAGDHLEGITLMEGKKVLELSNSSETKGTAVARLRAELDADAVVFLGDDLTDESVFETLDGDDLGVKIGEGPTVATARVADPEAVAVLLEELAAARESP